MSPNTNTDAWTGTASQVANRKTMLANRPGADSVGLRESIPIQASKTGMATKVIASGAISV